MTSRPRLTPQDPEGVRDAVASAVARGEKLEIVGGGSKDNFGAPGRTAALLDMRELSRVIDYQPRELTIEVEAGVPLADVNALLAEHGQTFAFDAFDPGAMFGGPTGRATVGGAMASAVAGPGRLQGGGPRDHLLGFEAVSGRGELFVAGGKVVKNVTGYDVSKLMANSWGRMAAMTKLTLRVAPRPAAVQTLACADLRPEAAVQLMCEALKAPVAVAAAAALPTATLLRLEGFERSLAIRERHLRERLAGFGVVEPLDGEVAANLWRQTREAAWLADSETLWRIGLAPTRAAGLVRRLWDLGAKTFMDLGGARIWAGLPAEAGPRVLREAVAGEGGHATLIRAPADFRTQAPAFHPSAPGVAALSRRVIESFDPCGVFRSGRFHEDADAH
ncbi:FAD-binding protein [Phenylobacterium sp. LjRoot225]|uniref:FAD-binding protein n=1 Tax=Phenylobacterium sp. LjRoot225 TaxID=3342285 RepID=UPI003ECD3486